MSASKFLYGPTRRAWAKVNTLEVVCYITATDRNDAEAHDPYDHDRVTIEFLNGRRKFFIALTTHTQEELLALKQILNAAIDAAIPVVESLDTFSQSEYDSGAEHLSPRLFRSRPVLVIRDMTARLVKGRHTPTTSRRTDERQSSDTTPS